MSYLKHPIDLGSPVPELKNSPIFSNIDDEQAMIEAQIPEERMCYFNGEIYQHGTFIKSNSIILQCDRGVWVEAQKIDEL